jgi:4-amino-4-deoxy-L-arabinose transferase-like glycosyltransferase
MEPRTLDLAGSPRPWAVFAAMAALAWLGAWLWLTGHVELTFDEAYYTLWSRDLAWGYLDHPPGVAIWIRASTILFGPSEFGIRALNMFVFAAMPALAGAIAWRLFGSARTAFLAAVLWMSMPLLAGAPIVTPDAPLTVFWTLALAGLVEVWRGRAWGWALLGAGLGLALLSKFTAAFLGAGVALAMLATPSLRVWFRRPAPYLAAFGALALFSPFLAWNAAHDWGTFAKQFGRIPPHGFAPRYLLEFAGAQIALMNPLIFLAAAAAIPKRSGGARDGEARRLLLAMLAPAAVYFGLHALHDRVQANWTAPLYPAIAILAAGAGVCAPGFARAAIRGAPALGLAAVALVYVHLTTGFPPMGAADPAARIGGWRNLAREVDARAKEQGAAFVLARGYAAASLLTYYGDGALPVIQREERARWLFQPPPPEGLFASPGVALGEAKSGYAAELAAHFRHVETIARLSRLYRGVPAEEFVLYRVGEPIGPVLGEN